MPVMQEEVLDLWLPKKHVIRHPPAGGDGDSINSDSDDDIRLIDGTVGLGGHTITAMNAAHAAGNSVRVLGIDLDASALAQARKRTRERVLSLAKAIVDDGEKRVRRAAAPLEKPWCNIAFHHGSFAQISPDLLVRHSLPSQVHGILLDCGINSSQIDNSKRGFTFKKDGPLDMRFDTTTIDNKQQLSTTAQDIVNTWSASAMAAIFKTFADEPYAEEIAAAIVEWRSVMTEQQQAQKPHRSYRNPHSLVEIQTTLELRFVIEEAVEKQKEQRDGRKNLHDIWRPDHNKPYQRLNYKKKEKSLKKYEETKSWHANHVMRVFQALRIEVNNELGHIRSIFEREIGQCLEVGGRLVMIAFQPGEDGIIREGMAGMVASGEFRLVTPEEDGLRPTPEEVKANGRARTARLRAVERIQ